MADNKMKYGIKFDEEKTFGVLMFLDFLANKSKENSDPDGEERITTGRKYDVQSKGQKMSLVVVLPPEVEKKEFEYKTLVTLVNPEIKSYSFAEGNRGKRLVINVAAEDMVQMTKNTEKPKPQKSESGAK